MSSFQLYREQAAKQKLEADAATLENVRERCQRASNAWAALAARSARAEGGHQAAAVEAFDMSTSDFGRGLMPGSPPPERLD